MKSQRLPKRSENYAAWYNALVKQAGLAENAPVRGCMIIKPYGYAIWERMQAALDVMFKASGHVNAYFPIFIPKSYLSREAEHVAGFAKECAVVTHYRLKGTKDGVVVDPDSRLEEELILRPTSEAIVWDTYKRWIQSYRDLPLLINQWSNIVRWEMRTRLFLRTSEILWQEGHTAHATREEAEEEVLRMLNVYYDFARDYMATPLIRGIKPDHEKFAGAESTYTIEALMQDGKALQAGTSHFLGQKFSKAFDVKYASACGDLEYVWGTSWGVTTRLIGALVMIHSDDKGLVLPPKLSPYQVVMIPVYKTDSERLQLVERLQMLSSLLIQAEISVKLDDRDDYNPGWKFAEYELKGVPIRLVIGPRDLADETVELVRRDTGEKLVVPVENLEKTIKNLLNTIQDNLYQQAKNRQESNSFSLDSYEEFKCRMAGPGGFVLAHWDGTVGTAQKIQSETKSTIRCIPLDGDIEPGKCIYSGAPSSRRVLFATGY